jgi:acetoin utilization protein AcuB
MKTHTKPVRQYPTVKEFMTPSPLTIAPTQSLAEAHKVMREHQVRHLPVLDGGHVVGMVSQRDLFLVESLPGATPNEVQVEEAMVEDLFTVAPDAPIGEVVEQMIEKKLGSAIVREADGDKVLGVFTTIDALRALHHLLER